MTPERIQKVRESLAELRVDALILTSPANRRWATGFTSYAGKGFSTDIALVTRDTVDLLVSRNNVEWARGESEVANSVIAHTGAISSGIASWVMEHSVASIGIEGEGFPHSYATQLAEALPDVTISYPTSLRDDWRAAKDKEEIARIEQATRVTDEVFEDIARTVEPGMTERHVARAISARLTEFGDGLGFDVIVASGPNSSRPHHRPGDRIIGENEPIIIDMGGQWEGYTGDLTRTLWLGKPSQQFIQAYRAVLAAQDATKTVIRSGTPVREVAEAADASLQRSGFGEYIVHSVGHGIGLEIHEAPAIRRDLDTTLPTNAVVTVEPGIYIPGWGGVRIEDVVVVGESGCRTLTTASKLEFD